MFLPKMAKYHALCLQLPAALSRRPIICGEVTDFGEGGTCQILNQLY